jgi:hypothetical protein
MIDDLERELTRAMADDVADLIPPHLDLRRIQRRPARRLVVPGAIVAVAVAAAAPIAAAKTGVLDHAPVSADQDVVPGNVGQLAPPANKLPATPPLPSVSAPHLPGAAPVLPPSVPLPHGCTVRHRTFSSDERAAALRQLRQLADGLAGKVLGAGHARRVAVLSAAQLDRMVPRVGATISYFDCLPSKPLSAAKRAAAIAEVRRAAAQVQTAVMGARSALEHALGSAELPGWLGDIDVTVLSQTAQRMVIRIDFGSPRPTRPVGGSITVTIRMADRSIVAIDRSLLTLPPGIPVPPNSLPSVPIPAPPTLPVPGLPTGGR